jgi:acetylornithine deacetylase/succinyl-diaminopimelate desuccinylase-like protein
VHGLRIVRLPDDGVPASSPLDHPVLTAIRTVIEGRYGPVPTGPFFQSRSTNDSRVFRRYGIPSYGFSPFLVLSTDTFGVAGVNESIALPAYLDGVELYVELLRHLVGPSPRERADGPSSGPAPPRNYSRASRRKAPQH